MGESEITPPDISRTSKQIADEVYLPHVAKGAMINFSGSLARTTLAYVYTLILARMLPLEELGQYFLMVTIISILGIFSTVGLDLGVVRFVALYLGEQKNLLVRRTLWSALGIGSLVSIVVLALVIGITPRITESLWSDNPAVLSGFRIFALAIPFWMAARLFNATTQGMHEMRYQVFSRDLGEQISRFAISLVVLIAGAGLIGVIWANVAALVIAMFLSMVFALTLLPKPGKQESPEGWPVRRLLKYSYPLAFSNILVMVLVWIDMLLVGYLGTSGDVGVYGAAFKVSTASAIILTAFATVFTPVISDLYNRKKADELGILFKTITRWVFSFSFPIFLLMAFFSDPVMRLFGDDFVVGASALVLLALSQLITSSIGTAGLVVLMSGRSWLELINMVTSLAVNVTLCFLLIPSQGLMGAAIANAASAGVLNVLRAIEVFGFLRIQAYELSFLKPVLAGVASVGTIFLVSRFLTGDEDLLSILMLVAAFVGVYVIIMMALGLNDQDKAILRLIKSRLLRAGVGVTA